MNSASGLEGDRMEEIDTDTYWTDVRNILLNVYKLSKDDAEDAVSNSRNLLADLSKRNQLLAYNEGVPQSAADIWKYGAGANASKKETNNLFSKAIKWYANRHRDQRIPTETHSLSPPS